jgi:hypothetical protein
VLRPAAANFWPYKRWTVRALAAQGKNAEALSLAERTPCDPRTLTRAARDQGDDQPAFALAAGLLAICWLAQGYGYEIASADVWAAFSTTTELSERMGQADGARSDIRRIAASVQGGGNLVARVLGRELGLP